MFLGSSLKNAHCKCRSYAEAYKNSSWERLKIVCHEPKTDICRNNDAYTQMKSNFTVKIEDEIIQLMSDTETITIENTDFNGDDQIQKIKKSELK